MTTVFDLQVWDDPDVDAHVFENVGDVKLLDGNVLIVTDSASETVIAAFNAQGWLRYEITTHEEAE